MTDRAGSLIRAATSADADAIAVMEQMLFGDDAWGAAQVRDELTGPGRRGWVVTDSTGRSAPSDDDGHGRVIGYAVTMTLGDVADLQRIGVHPGHQRQGLAGRLLEQAVARAAADGAERMLLEVSAANAAARGFYAGRGFVEIDRRPRYYRDGSDALVLRRSLVADAGEG